MKNSNPERAQRILAAATKLFIYFGFDKTTVSDIAREAGISKGAIYLHYESKDALLEALILRELEIYAEHWLSLINDDPDAGSIGSFYKNSLFALSASEFMTAVFKQDNRILGNYLRKPGNFFEAFSEGKSQSDRFIFVSMMQQAGGIRDDLNPAVIAHIMDMLAYALVSMGDIKPAESIPPLDETIETIAEIMDRALTPFDGGNPQAGKEIIKKLADQGRITYEKINANKEK